MKLPRTFPRLQFWQFWGLISLCLLMPLENLLRLQGVPLSAVDLLVWGLGAVLLLDCVLAKKLGSIWFPPLPAILLVLWVVLCAAISAITAETSLSDFFRHQGKESFQAVEYLFVGYLVFRNLIADRNHLQQLLWALGAATLGIILVALFQTARGGQPFSVDGGFNDRNQLGAFLALVSPLGVAMAFSSRDHLVRVLASIPAVVGLLVITSGGAYLALLLGILTAGALLGRRQLAIVAGASALIMALVFGIFPGQAERLRDSVQPYVRQPDGPLILAQRYHRWQANLELIERQPVFGVGPGLYQSQINLYYGDELQRDKSGVNTDDVSQFNVLGDEPGTFSWYFITACELGLPGMWLLVWMLVYFWGRAARSATAASEGEPKREGLSAGVVGSLMAILCLGVFTHLMVRGLALLCVFLFAAADALCAWAGEDVDAAPLAPGGSGAFLSKPVFGERTADSPETAESPGIKDDE